MEWMMMPLKRYADFEGRSQRMEFWMFSLLLMIVYTVLIGAMVTTVGFGNTPRDQGPPASFWLIAMLLGLVALGTFIPQLAVQVRRFHDQDKSGWFWLLGLIPYAGGIVLIVFMCIEGTRGPNRFGPDPKDPEGRYDVTPYGQPRTPAEILPRRPDLM